MGMDVISSPNSWKSSGRPRERKPVVGHVLGDGRRSGTAQIENTVRHTKCCRIFEEGGRSTGVLLHHSNLFPAFIHPRTFLLTVLQHKVYKKVLQDTL